MQVFSVQLGNKKFEVVGVANVVRKTAHFQAVINGVPFMQDEDYEVTRAALMNAIQLNQPEKHAGVN